MSIRPQPVRPPQQRPTTPQRSCLRPWPVLPATVRTQLSQQFAQVLRRVRDGEAGHAEHAE
jgi:hypothetical protein